MHKYIKDFNISIQDIDADGTPERMIVTYEIRDHDDKTVRANGRFEPALNPFETVLSVSQGVREMIALRENISLPSSSSSSSQP